MLQILIDWQSCPVGLLCQYIWLLVTDLITRMMMTDDWILECGRFGAEIQTTAGVWPFSNWSEFHRPFVFV